jgi:hypothetical protein
VVQDAHAELRGLSASVPPALPGRRALVGLGVLSLASVLLVARHAGTPFGWSTIAALALAPLAVTSVAALGHRVAGARFAVAAGIVYAVLPFAGRLGFYGAFLDDYDHRVMPAFVGLAHTGWFALGVGVCVATVALPERIAAALGVAGAAVAAIAWVDVSWTGLYGQFHESTWSPTLVSFLPLAATIGLAIRRPWLAAAVTGWLAVLVLRGMHRTYTGGGFWLSLAAAAPQIALLLTSVALLVPPLRLRRSPELRHDPAS